MSSPSSKFERKDDGSSHFHHFRRPGEGHHSAWLYRITLVYEHCINYHLILVFSSSKDVVNLLGPICSIIISCLCFVEIVLFDQKIELIITLALEMGLKLHGNDCGGSQ